MLYEVITVVADRDDEAIDRTLATLHGQSADAIGVEVDVTSRESVEAMRDAALAAYGAVHVLCNNAGVMALPRCETTDGFEMQLGTNHLGHFALVGSLLDRLEAAEAPRVVVVSSHAHRMRNNFV